MNILEIVLIIVAFIFTILWILSIRRKAKIGNRESQGNINATFLFVVSLLVVLIFKISPFHLLWMFLLSAFIGQIYQTFPFVLLSIPAIYLEKLAYIGLDHDKIRDMKFFIEDVTKLMMEKKISREEALKIILEKAKQDAKEEKSISK